VILGTIAFRSSLEVTNDPRVPGFSRRLLPWLGEVGCDDELDPIERELLATPLGQLSDSQSIDARWAGEGASFYCWTLKLLDPPAMTAPADPSPLLDVLSILRPAATRIIESASLRDIREIQDACRQYALIRSLLQEARVGPPASDIVRKVNLERLHKVGLNVDVEAVRRASEIVSGMTPEERAQVAGLYFIRNHASLRFFDDRPGYFGQGQA
jgi:hypothetical protein